MHIMYDHAADELSARWIEGVDPHGKPCQFMNPVLLTPSIAYLWAWEPRKLAICNVIDGTMTFSPYELDTRYISGRHSLNSRVDAISQLSSIYLFLETRRSFTW